MHQGKLRKQETVTSPHTNLLAALAVVAAGAGVFWLVVLTGAVAGGATGVVEAA